MLGESCLSLSLELFILDNSDLNIYFAHSECPCDEFSDFSLIVSGFLSQCAIWRINQLLMTIQWRS